MSLQVVLQFSQRVGSAAGVESYQVTVLQAPGRGWGGPLQAAYLDELQAASVRRAFSDYLQRAQRGSWRETSPLEMNPLRAIGNQLFMAFPETVQKRLHQALASARRDGKKLSIVLSFEPSAQALLALPWELLHSPETQTFLALHAGLTRGVALASGFAAAPQAAGRILGVWAEPDGVAPLSERRKYGPAPRTDGAAREGFDWIEGEATLSKMAQSLQQDVYDGLHLVAHGRGGEAHQDFMLALADEEGRAQWVSGEQMATFLSGYERLRFVYLDVCAAGYEGAQGFAPGGLALALCRAGVSTVIIMQEDMAQKAAGVMAQAYYDAVAEGYTAAQALSAGRRAVRVQLDDALHWSVPALYTLEGVREPLEALPAVDAFLDVFAARHVYTFGLLTLLYLLLAHLSYRFATTAWGDVSAISLLLAQSVTLPLLGAILQRGGLERVARRYDLDKRAKAWAALDVAFSAGVWAGMGWFVVGLALLGLTWGELWRYMGVGGRQLLWAVLLGLVTLAGYSGARQSIRQARLFLREGQRERRWLEWPVAAFLLLMPLLGYWAILWLRVVWGPG